MMYTLGGTKICIVSVHSKTRQMVRSMNEASVLLAVSCRSCLK